VGGLKAFQFDQKYSPKEFVIHDFAGSKSATLGKSEFTTKVANTKGKFDIPNAEKVYSTKAAEQKTMPVKAYAENDKKMPTREFAGQRPYLKHSMGAGGGRDHMADKPGESPNMAAGWSGNDVHPMTIDDIRTLLNKNK
jgi:hypothetical protein